MRPYTLIIIRHRYISRDCRYIAGCFESEEKARSYADLFYPGEPREIENNTLQEAA